MARLSFLQINQAVRRSTLYNLSERKSFASSSMSPSIQPALISELFSFKLIDIDNELDKFRKENRAVEWIEGIGALWDTLSHYLFEIDSLSSMEIDESYATIVLCSAARIMTGEYARASPSYNGRKVFSDVAVAMNHEATQIFKTNESTCYGKASIELIITSMFSKTLINVFILDLSAC
jgi:hypothetical protein